MTTIEGQRIGYLKDAHEGWDPAVDLPLGQHGVKDVPPPGGDDR